MTQDTKLTVDPRQLRAEVRTKYREVAADPSQAFHFHTGRLLAKRLGYPGDVLDALPDEAIASFAGVDNPFAAAPLPEGSRVVDLGSGGGFDCVIAARLVGPSGRVIGVDMTPEMLERARRVTAELDIVNVEYREGVLEELPVESGWADVVISNGVLNLVADKDRALAEAFRVLRPGGVLQVADIAVGAEVPHDARCNVDLWTDCIAGARSVDEWCELITGAGFENVAVGIGPDTSATGGCHPSFEGVSGETNARTFQVQAHTFRARRPRG